MNQFCFKATENLDIKSKNVMKKNMTRLGRAFYEEYYC